MAVAAGLGLAEFPFSGAKAFWRWVEQCEQGGVNSLWQTERVVSTEPFLDVMSVMAGLAGATERLKFGMNVAAVGFRDPLVLAKQCATIDVLSGGRLLPAFGVGSPRAPEWAATGRQPKGHGTAADEALEIMARLWAEERVTFTGAHYSYRDAAIAPKPVQNPLPLWIGGSSAAAIERTARYGTGWLGGFEPPSEVGPTIAAIKRAAARRGRPIESSHFGAGFGFRFGSWDEPETERAAARAAARSGRDPRTVLAIGDARAIRDKLAAFVDVGIAKFVLRPIAWSDADMEAQTARFVAEVLPEMPVLDRRWKGSIAATEARAAAALGSIEEAVIAGPGRDFARR